MKFIPISSPFESESGPDIKTGSVSQIFNASFGINVPFQIRFLEALRKKFLELSNVLIYE